MSRAPASGGRGAATLTVLAAAGMLSGCGFRLEGRYPLPAALSTVRIDTVDAQTDFYFGLRRTLLSSGAHLTDDVSDASAAVLHISADSYSNVIVTVSSRNIPTEYELTYTVRYSVDGAGGKQLIAPEQRVLVRDYNYSESEQLAKQHEQQILSAALGQELATVVMRRLSSLQQRG
jgi:LPS-assembly lipoprotein